MKMVVDQLIEGILCKRNPGCVGIDPDWEKIPNCYKKENTIQQSIYSWACDVIDAVYDIVAVVKPQIAFYERFGSLGIKVFEDVVKYAQNRGLVVVDDAKRNDIGSTARAYAYAHLDKEGPIHADFLTVSPFLGSDSLSPFIDVSKENGKGLFILVKTSNDSSKEISNALNEKNESIMEFLAKYVNQEGMKTIGKYGYSLIGAVVGATFPDEAKYLRQIMNRNFFLVPGYGVQGGTAKDVISCFNPDGLGAIVSSSRGILYSYLNVNINPTKEEYKEFVRDNTLKMRDDIYKELKKYFSYMKY